MTIQDQRVAAAEIEGCKWIHSGGYRFPTFDPVIFPELYNGMDMADGSDPIGNLECDLCNIPDYLNSTDAAIRLVEVLEKEGWLGPILHREIGGDWTCTFYQNEEPSIHCSPLAPEIIVRASTLALAITQAALRAKGRWVQEGENE